jgi:predicted nucleic acid-binding protein
VSFVDTNVLVYATATSAPFRDRARAALVRLAADEQLSVSRQILREYVAVMTRPQTWGRALSLAEAMTDAALLDAPLAPLGAASNGPLPNPPAQAVAGGGGKGGGPRSGCGRCPR